MCQALSWPLPVLKPSGTGITCKTSLFHICGQQGTDGWRGPASPAPAGQSRPTSTSPDLRAHVVMTMPQPEPL